MVPQTRGPVAEAEVDWGKFPAVIGGETMTLRVRGVAGVLHEIISSGLRERSPPFFGFCSVAKKAAAD